MPRARAPSIIGSSGNKCKISIHIDNHFQAKVYTSQSTVAGHVTIVNPGPKDLRFDHVQITLHGFTKTRVNCAHGAQEGRQHFLDLHMPIAEDSYPVPRVYEVDQTYTFPFIFTIPENMVLHQCSHRCDNSSVREHHSALPPSLGRWGKDDMAPEMARVEYFLKALVYREMDEHEGYSEKKKTAVLLEKTEPINVLPAVPERPPLGLTKRDKEYVMVKSKSIKKNIITPKSGEFTVTASQPPAVMLSADGCSAHRTHVTLGLRFDPSTAQSPAPKILHVGGKVTAHTYFSLAGTGGLPNLGDWVKTYGVGGRGEYRSAVGLPDLPVEQGRWRRELHPRLRRDSGYGSEELAASGSETAGEPWQRTSAGTSAAPSSPFSYSMTLKVPVDLPVQKKVFVPTFHSCSVSRVYILTLDVAVSAGSSNTTLTVKVPLQVGVESGRRPVLHGVAATGYDALPPSFEAAREEAAIEGPSVQNRGELPGYSESR